MFQRIFFAIYLVFVPSKAGLRSRVERELIVAQHQLLTTQANVEIAQAEKALLLRRIKRLEATVNLLDHNHAEGINHAN